MPMKLKIAWNQNKSVTPRSFKKGDLVLKTIELQRKLVGEGKLALNWEDPYRAIKDIDRGAYNIVELTKR